MGKMDFVHLNFMSAFWPYVNYFKVILLQFQETLLFAEDVNSLRSRGIINPFIEGFDKLSQFSNGIVSFVLLAFSA